MIRFECDSCGVIKEAGEKWILGFAAENIGVTAARRELAISSVWDRDRAVERFAVHFCCEKCRDNYMQALFAEPSVTRSGAPALKRRRVKRVGAGEVVESVVAERPAKSATKTTTRIVRRNPRAA